MVPGQVSRSLNGEYAPVTRTLETLVISGEAEAHALHRVWPSPATMRTQRGVLNDIDRALDRCVRIERSADEDPSQESFASASDWDMWNDRVVCLPADSAYEADGH